MIVCTAAVQRVRQLVHQIEGQLNKKAVGTVIEPFDIDDLLRQIEVVWDDTSCVSPAPGR